MTNLRIKKSLSDRSRTAVLLILLMLSNSSLALEVLIHENHQHGEVQALSEMEAMDHDHGNHQIPEDLNQAEENCLCDDICCVSSAENSAFPYSSDDLTLEDNQHKLRNLYQSIKLDLLLPPPTSHLLS